MSGGTGPLALLRHTRRALTLTARAAPALLAGYLAASVIVAVVPIVLAWLTKFVFDGLGTAGGHLLVDALCLVVVGAISGLVPFASQYLRAQLGRKAGVAALDHLYAAIDSHVGLSRLEDPPFLDRVRLAHQAASGSPAGVIDGICGTATGAITSIGLAISLCLINPIVAGAVIAGGVPALVAELALNRRRAAMLWKISPVQRRELIFGMLLTDARAAQEIRLFGIGAFLRRRLRTDRTAANDAQRAVERREMGIQTVLGLVSAATTGAGLVLAVLGAQAGELSIGDVTMVMTAIAGVQSALLAAVRAVASFQQHLLMFEHFVAVVDEPADLPVRPAALPVPTLRRGIELRDVWFRYAPDLPWVLRGVSLVIPAGASMALVGPNGSGKSTLVKLLCRFYDPTRGAILWDGVDLRDLSPAELRRRLSVVFQDHVRYDMTAAENVALGNLETLENLTAPEQRSRVEAAARRAGVHEAIAGLPRGYDTLVTRVLLGADDGDEPTTGVPLSGGQWQRVALARAFLRDANDLLILDEPNSGLDAEAEHDIHSRLMTYQEGQTSLLISHRLNAVRGARRIAVLSDGRIVEFGDHSLLIASNGVYARLFRLQAKGYSDHHGLASVVPQP